MRLLNGGIIKIVWFMMLCGVFYWTVLLPDYRELKQQQQQLQVVPTIKPVVPQLKQRSHLDIISEVVRVADQNGIFVKVEQSPASQGSAIVIATQADFPILLSFIKTLSELSILLNEVTFHVEKNSIVTMNASLMDYPYLFHSHFDLLGNAENPMRSMDSSFVLSDSKEDVSKLNIVSIKQLKYVGYLGKKSQFLGLLQSLSGVSGLVVVGMTIGLEKAKVITVNEHHVVLQMPHHGVFVLLKNM